MDADDDPGSPDTDPVIYEVFEILRVHTEKIEQLGKLQSKGVSASRPSSWLLAGEPDADTPAVLRQRAWSDLHKWVKWIRRAYEVDNRQLPECWAEHDYFVQQLAALRCAHFEATVRPKATRDAVTWNDDWQKFLTRLRESRLVRQCGLRHEPRADELPISDVETHEIEVTGHVIPHQT